MREKENEGGRIAEFIDRHLPTLILGAIMVYTTFTSNDAVTSEKFRSIEASINELKSDLKNMRDTAQCPDYGRYSEAKK